MNSILVSMSVSLDGFAAGPGVSAEHPMGAGGERLHEWMFPATGVDAEQIRDRYATAGAVVVGRRTFDVGVDLWQDTPFPVPSFVVTHEPRDPMRMKSDTFTFVTKGLESTLRQARLAAGDRSVLIMGGPTIGRQFVRAGLVDEIHLQLVPVLLGAGTRLFDDLDGHRVELERTAMASSPHVTHLRFRVRLGG
jgi:dihydrofolate reductase